MYYRRFQIVILLLLMMVALISAGCFNQIEYSYPKAEEGVLDLTRINLENEVIKLDGQWEFYWNHLLEPSQLKEKKFEKIEYIDIPSSWNHYITDHKIQSGDGYATYRLIVTAKQSGKLGLSIPRIFTADKLWVNGKLISSAGRVGKTRNTMAPKYFPQVALFEARQGQNEIVIQVSNFYHRSGGILESLTLGSDRGLLKIHYKKIAYDLFLCGSLTVMGIYHLALFFLRKKDKSFLYFGSFCILIGIRSLLVGERFVNFLLNEYSWEIAHKIQTLTFYMGVPIILMFFMSVFPKYFHTKIIRIIQLISLIFGSVVVLAPAKIFTVVNPSFQVFTCVVIVYTLSMLFIINRHREKDIGLIIVGALALILTSLNDIIFRSVWFNDNNILFLRYLFKTGNLSSVGQFIFTFTNSLVLAKRFSNALEQEEVMTSELREMNLNLDSLVMKRTKDLEDSKRKIEVQKQELEKINQKLQTLSYKDHLTGSWNRRKYNETIQFEWRRCLRYKRPISLMILDIDFYKDYNDCYGHMAGDECLKRIAETIRNYFLRASDLSARYGGEEFVVVLPETDREEAKYLADLLRKQIENLKVPHSQSSVSSFVTASIGVTSAIPDRSSCPDKLFMIADKALYQAKVTGRNQVKFLPVDYV